MNRITKQLLLLLLLYCPVALTAQDCEILNRVQPDGSMMYYIQPDTFYQTSAKTLHGAVATNGDNYYFTLIPRPIIPKGTVKKFSGNLELKLKNDSVLNFRLFDTQYMEEDTTLVFFFEINKKQLPALRENLIEQAKFSLDKREPEVYTFMRHKDAIKEQLHCFLSQKNFR